MSRVAITALAMCMSFVCAACGEFHLANGGTVPPGKTQDQVTLDTLVCKDRARVESQTAVDQARGFMLGLTLSLVGMAIDYNQQNRISAGSSETAWKPRVTR